MTREELFKEAVIILEQEGWLAGFYAYQTGSRRLEEFAERYKDWQNKVDEARKQDLEIWDKPEDNS
jgi:hypothetical protein